LNYRSSSAGGASINARKFVSGLKLRPSGRWEPIPA
jgi:hypothetical protein